MEEITVDTERVEGTLSSEFETVGLFRICVTHDHFSTYLSSTLLTIDTLNTTTNKMVPSGAEFASTWKDQMEPPLSLPNNRVICQQENWYMVSQRSIHSCVNNDGKEVNGRKCLSQRIFPIYSTGTR